jgi:hypothetical protein
MTKDTAWPILAKVISILDMIIKLGPEKCATGRLY